MDIITATALTVAQTVYTSQRLKVADFGRKHWF